MIYEGLFIAVSGINGAGKSSIIKNIKKEFGHKCIIVNPYKHYDQFLSSNKHVKFQLCRLKSSLTIRKLCKKGYIVIVDRWSIDGSVYLELDETLDESEKDFIRNIESTVLKPDFTFFVDTYPKVALNRCKKRLYNEDDDLDLEFKKKEYALFKSKCRECIPFDGNDTLRNITKDCIKILKNIIIDQFIVL